MRARWLRSALSITLAVTMFATSVPVQAEEAIAVTGVIQEESAGEDAVEADLAEETVGEEAAAEESAAEVSGDLEAEESADDETGAGVADEEAETEAFETIEESVTVEPGNALTSSWYNNKRQEFLENPTWANGAPWGGRPPAISSCPFTGCAAYAADFAQYVFGTSNLDSYTEWTSDANHIQTGCLIKGFWSETRVQHWLVVLERNGDTLYTAEGNVTINGAERVRVTSEVYSISNGQLISVYGGSLDIERIITFDRETPVISQNVTAYANANGTITASYQISDNMGIGYYSTNVWLYGQDPSQAKRYEQNGLGADGKTVTVIIDPKDFDGFDGYYYISADVLDFGGRGAHAELSPASTICLYSCSADKSVHGTYKVIKDNVPIRECPYQTVNGKNTEIGSRYNKDTKVEVVGKLTNDKNNDWYCLENGYWIYSGNLKKVTAWTRFLESWKHWYFNPFYIWGGEPVFSVTTESAQRTSANLQFRVEQYDVGESHSAGSYHTIYLDGNGGSAGGRAFSCRVGRSYGYLPTGYRYGYTFDGWFTAAEGGSQVVSSDIFNASGDITLYAHWTRIILLEGECGPNLHFILYGDGELDITGSGEMTSHPWTNQYAARVFEVNFPDGLTKICLEAFAYCVNLGSVSIPDSVTEIVDGAFRNCEKMEAVRLPQNLTEIKEVVFACCYELSQITIPESVTKIGGAAFARCSSLSVVNLPEGLVQLDAEAFFDCDTLTEITIPKALTKSNSIYRYEFVYDYQIGPFYGCDGLKTVHFEEGITNILQGLFAHCPGIEVITIPDTVKTIQDNAFYDCSNLSSVTMHDGLEQLNAGAFGKCISLTAINIPDTVTKIGGAAFARCTALRDVHLPMSLKQIDAEAFFDCDAITEITLPPAVEKSDSQYFYEYVYDYQIGPFYGCDGLKTVKFAPGATNIGPAMLANCPGLEQIEMADTVTRIGANAFSNCSNLKDVKFSSGLTQIDSYAFSNCDGLVEITLPKSIQNNQSAENVFRDSDNLKTVKFEEGATVVPNRLFSNCVALEQIEFPSSMEIIGVLSFADCKSLKEVVIPDNVSVIDLGAFTGCENLTSVQLPTGLKRIYNKAFGYTGITEITIPAKLEQFVDGYTPGVDFGEGVFAHCMNLKAAKFEDGATKVPANLFKNCPGLERIEFPESMEKIENYAFANCDGLKTVELPDGITSIGVAAFRDCSNLEMIQLPDGLIEIGNVAFANTALTEVMIPAGVSKYLDAYGSGFGWSEGVFKNCTSLKTAKVADGATKVIASLFKNCPELNSVYIPDTVAEFGNDALANCPLLVVSCGEYSFANAYCVRNNIPVRFVDSVIEGPTGLNLNRDHSFYMVNTAEVMANDLVAMNLSYLLDEKEGGTITDVSLEVYISQNTPLVKETLRVNGAVLSNYGYYNQTLSVTGLENSGNLDFCLQQTGDSKVTTYAIISYQQEGIRKREVIGVINAETGDGELYGYSLSVQDGAVAETEFGLNYYVDCSAAVADNEDTAVTFTLADGSSQTVKAVSKEAIEGEATVYRCKFVCNLAPAQLSTKVSAVINSGNIKMKLSDYSAKEYAQALLSESDPADSGELSDKLKELVRAIFDYGAYAQLYFSYNESDLANAGLYTGLAESQVEDTDIDVRALLNDSRFDISGTLTGKSLSFVGASLACDQKTKMKLYVSQMMESEASAYTVTVKDVTADEMLNDSSYALNVSGQIMNVELKGIAAKNLDHVYQIQIVKKEDSTDKLIVNYSPMTYVIQALEGNNEKLKNLVKSLYFMNQAANAYI